MSSLHWFVSALLSSLCRLLATEQLFRIAPNKDCILPWLYSHCLTFRTTWMMPFWCLCVVSSTNVFLQGNWETAKNLVNGNLALPQKIRRLSGSETVVQLAVHAVVLANVLPQNGFGEFFARLVNNPEQLQVLLIFILHHVSTRKELPFRSELVPSCDAGRSSYGRLQRNQNSRTKYDIE